MQAPLPRYLRRAAACAVLVAAALSGVPATRAVAADVTFEQPTAISQTGDALTFSTVIHAATQPTRVELLSHLPTEEVVSVEQATLSAQGDGTFQATLRETGHVTPNTTFDYRFRAWTPDGPVLGPQATYTVTDDRFDWKTKQGGIVRLHWYEGDEAFADHAIAIGDKAIDDASRLLGVTETEPVDFFIYASEVPFRDALGPGTRENVGGQANAAIRTLFGLISPSEIDSSWVDVLVTHELTHLVFNTAIDNPYHEPPRWLNEGLAVYQSEGYGPSDRLAVQNAARSNDLIPLEGLAGLFPTDREGFTLAYAESVSAVDYIIRTFGQDSLVKLIRSYHDGVTDDEAFRAAIGEDSTALNDDWLASLGAVAHAPFGPQPAPPGLVPPDWTGAPAASIAPTAGQGTEGQTSPGSTAGVGQGATTDTPGGGRGSDQLVPATLGVLAVIAILALVGLTLVLVVRRRRAASERPAGWPPGWPPQS